MAIDPRFLAESGREVFTGNELLVKGALETEGGVNLLTGYPGSPVAGFFDILGDLRDLLNEQRHPRLSSKQRSARGGGRKRQPDDGHAAPSPHSRASACTSPPTPWRSATLGGAASARRRRHHHGRRPLVRQHPGSGRQPIPLRASSHGGRRARLAAAIQGLDRSQLQTQPGGGPLHRLHRHRRPGRRRRDRDLPAQSISDDQYRTKDRAGNLADRSEQGASPAADLATGIALRRALRRRRCGRRGNWGSIGSSSDENAAEPAPLGFIVTGMAALI